jgi:hypothetical protein
MPTEQISGHFLFQHNGRQEGVPTAALDLADMPPAAE